MADSAQGAVQLAQSSGAIKEITVEGAQRIAPETIKSYLLVQTGDAFNPGKIDRSLKSLFTTGLFADVSLHRKGDTLVVRVVENPVINRIAFEGNAEVDSDDLRVETSLRPRVIYTRTKVQKDVKRILAIYRSTGRFAATVEPKVIQLEQNRVDLVFEINEGDLTEIRSIRFVGNREFGDSRLRGVIRTRQSTWWRFLSSDDKYDPDRVTFDRELLRRFYLSDGFADFRVMSAVAELTPDRKDFFLTYTVDEGARYRFGKVEIQARLRNLKVEDISGELEFEQGDWYDQDAVNKAIRKLTDKVGDLGFAFIDIRPRINRDREKRIIDVVFEVNEGPRVFVERIDIVGNVRTQDKVIRREFRLVEGDAFNSSKMRRSRQRIQNLGFFETVSVERQPGSAPDKTVVKVDVQEKSTGQLSFGAGFSTTNGFLGDIGILEKNFLGKGQQLSLKVTLAALKSEIDLSFTEPYFLGREIRAGFDIFRVSQDLQDFSSFDTDTTGFGLRGGYRITEDLRQDWGYSFRLSKISDIANDASQLIQAAAGTETTSQVSHSITYDKRDSAILPTDGFVVRVRNDLAGLGGSVRHFRNHIKAAKYYPIADQWVASASGSAGYIVGLGDDVNVLERFFIGGDNLRGFASRGVGPRDSLTEDALGGEWFYTGSLQLDFPLGLPDDFGIGGRAFTDFGSIGKLSPTASYVQDETSLRASAGIGLTWTSPFGPVGMDAALPIIKEDFDLTENIRVNFGTRF
ncbi:MAG: outer membrane protein assembly factor BamA [Rhodospirillales bacterium]|nr:outer membrane protein assembly factor BamA [Alphaproteobacteria bacterium]MBL6947842.1 outer membrane protein assembly factor BamA [Rhodospirillales bacterium]